MKLNPFKKLNWKDPENRKHFGLNIFWGIVLSVLLNYVAAYTDMGYNALNDAYDHLVKADFKKAIEDMSRQNKPPLDSQQDRIRLIIFDEETYEAETQGFWTPRKLLGDTILKTVQLGAKVIVVDFAMNKPAPLCQKDAGGNQAFLKALGEAAKTARQSGAVILLPRPESGGEKSRYERKFESLIDENQDVIKEGIGEAYEYDSDYYDDTSDYQVRHLRFYDRTPENEIFFSIQLVAAVYLWHGRSDGDEIIKEARQKILAGNKEFQINTQKPIQVYAQDDPKQEYLSARYVFRIAPRDIIEKYPEAEDPCAKYPELCRNPYYVRDQTEAIYKDKAVVIGSVNPEMGDVHLTPIGKLPGVFLVANGVNLFLEGLQIHDPGIAIRVVIEILGILAAAYLFLCLHPSWAALLLAVLYLFATPLSEFLFSTCGVLTDFWFPIIGVGISRLITDTDEFVLKLFSKIKKGGQA